jgi:hypothetical protein
MNDSEILDWLQSLLDRADLSIDIYRPTNGENDWDRVCDMNFGQGHSIRDLLNRTRLEMKVSGFAS